LSALFSIFGFLGVILHGFDLIAQTVVLGSILFLLILAVPLAPRLGPDGASLPTIARKVIRLVAPFGLLLIITVTGLSTRPGPRSRPRAS
jgi:putative copper resistance protein D